MLIDKNGGIRNLPTFFYSFSIKIFFILFTQGKQINRSPFSFKIHIKDCLTQSVPPLYNLQASAVFKTLCNFLNGIFYTFYESGFLKN